VGFLIRREQETRLMNCISLETAVEAASAGNAEMGKKNGGNPFGSPPSQLREVD